MENSYCGKNCDFCVSRSEGRCIGCRPSTNAPISDSIYISGSNKTDPKSLPFFPNQDPSAASVPSSDPFFTKEQSIEAYNEESFADFTNNTENRFSKYCPICICCKGQKIDGCNSCQKTFTCEKYSKKGIMNTIIEAKMEAWGMVDHGLKNAVPFLYVLLVCFILEFIFPVASVIPGASPVFFFISIVIVGVRAFAYYKLRSFNTSFLSLTALTAAYIFTSLFLTLLDNINYGIIGMLLSFAASAVKLAISVLCYKISFDAYAELVSPVDATLEGLWLRLWKLTLFFYGIAFIAGLLTKTGPILDISSFILTFGIASALLSLITFILMIGTIKVCKND